MQASASHRAVSRTEEHIGTGTLYCVAWRALAPQLLHTPASRGKRLGASSQLAVWQLVTSLGVTWKTWGKRERIQGMSARRSPIAGSTSGCLAVLRRLQVSTHVPCGFARVVSRGSSWSPNMCAYDPKWC